MSLKLLHTADLHMDSPFEALSSGKAAARRAELRELPGKIARLAVEEKVDIILLCGDILDSEYFYRETGEELFRALRNLSAAVFIAPGNHDYYSEKSPYAGVKLPRNVYVFKEPHIEYFDFSEYGFRVFGAAFTDKSSKPLLEGFKVDKLDGVVDIMCLHGDLVSGSARAGVSKYNPVTPEQIALSGVDYLALGHIHKASGLKRAGRTWYSYPGCPEGRGFDETGEKTVNIVELQSTGDTVECSIKAVDLSERRYETLKVDVSDKDPLLAVQMLLPDDTIRDIYKIELTGETDTPVETGRLLNNLSQYFYELVITDSTRLRHDIWEATGDDTLRGLFLSKMRALYDAAGSDDARHKAEQAVRWGLAALENREEVVIHED